KVTQQGAPSVEAAVATKNGVAGAAVEQALLDRLHLKLGDRFLAGNLPLVARAVLMQEPDRLSRGFALGPRVLTTKAAVEQGGFLAPGLPFGETARIALPPGADLQPSKAELRQAVKGPIRIRDPHDAPPRLRLGEPARTPLPPGADLQTSKAELRQALKGPIRIRDRDDAAPGIH